MIEARNKEELQDYIEALLERKEADDLEFKSAAGGFPGNFWDTYSAFANTDGGTIIFGVVEKHGQFFLDSLTDEQIEKYKRDFWNNVNNRSTVNFNLMKTDDVTVEEYRGHKFMTFIYLELKETNAPFIELPNHIMEHSSVIMKEIINVRRKRSKECLQMQILHIP